MFKYKSSMQLLNLRFYLLLGLMMFLLLIVFFARYLTPYDPNLQSFGSLEAPGSLHWLGTDNLGRDLLSRILVALQTTVLATSGLILLTTVMGTTIGLVSVYVPAFIENLLMRLSDFCLALPTLIFAMALTAVLQGGLKNAVLSLALVGWAKYAGIARSQALVIKNSDFVKAAYLAGSKKYQIIYRHIWPNITHSILLTATLDIGTMMLELSSLSFLGLGALPPTAELGSMLNAGRSMLQTHPHLVLAPGLTIFFTVMIFNLFSDTLVEYLAPQSSNKRSNYLKRLQTATEQRNF